MDRDKDLNETEKTEKEKSVNNVQKIFHVFNDNLDGVNLNFRKFESIAIGEDETMKDESSNFFKEVLSELETEISKVKEEQSNGFDDSKAKLIEITKDSEAVETEVITEAELKTELENEEEDDPRLNELFKRFAVKMSKRPKISPKNFEILSRGTFLMLNNYFEHLLADLLTYYYNKFKNSLDAKEFKVSLQELNEYDSIEEITKHLILKEVENIIVEKTFDQLLEHFEKNLNISLEKEIISWDKIIEIRERRHLIVHNSSIVNKKYISRTKNPYNYNIGDIVHIDKDYFHQSYRQLRVAGQVLVFNCWGNWDKENLDNAIYQMLVSSFESLNNKDFESVLKICKYCEQITARNEEQEDYLLRLKINKAISLKKQNNKTELTKVLKTIKIGTSTPIFKIAFQILNDDYKGLVELFQKAILLDELIIDYYLDWPIFDFVRSNEKLNKTLLNTFKM